jgi:adenosylhomocysteine nucleosidase
MSEDAVRHVAVLAPMPLEFDAIVAAFGLSPDEDRPGRWIGRVGGSRVTCTHIGMGPPSTRSALERMLDESASGYEAVDHVMIAGICGGLDPEVAVGTLINPEVVVEHSTGRAYRHDPPGGEPVAGKLVTTEDVTLDPALSARFFEDGFVAVDMETSAVAEVCEARGRPWSVYRCIGDRIFDGLLDERVMAMTRPDGSGDMEAIGRLLADNPDLRAKLEQLGRDATRAAKLAAEAAARACRALDDGDR